MPFALVVAALWLVLHHLDFLTQSGENNGALDLCALDNGRTDGRVRAVVDEEHLAEDNRVTLLQIPGSFSIAIMSPLETTYCFPPVLITATSIVDLM